jgi:hypothetical protein
MKADDPLDKLFAAAREDAPDTSAAEFGVETRVMARIREERGGSWFAWAWRMCPYFAALALAAGAWAYLHPEALPDSESLYAGLRQGSATVLDFYLSGDE